ncbi:hypothetical protein H5410_053270 [Solanum commersonii]|uniref:R13L1/DRL21-like LRR repeat region domain-containing protein n=1 Tax=Solanum commersonii TaxID=4109 RepID=A0A9J5X3D4_SOLCO|nr:hypothetical protein H5410_053270 [Solanum commersonii]
MHDLVHDLVGDILKSKLFDPKGDGGEISSQFLRVLNLSVGHQGVVGLNWQELPDEMANMISLRHIYYNSLVVFKVGLEKGHRIEEIGHLKNLRGELTIEGLQLVCNREEAQTTYLQEKPKIYKLECVWSHDEPEGCEASDEYVLDCLQPHPNLKTLAVVEYLVRLKLSGCKRCKEIPLLGQLKFLQHLELVGFHKVECIGPKFYGIDGNNNGSSNNKPLSKCFRYSKNYYWRICLALLIDIRNCPLLKSTPNQFEILRELSIDGVDSEIPLLNLCINLTSLNFVLKLIQKLYQKYQDKSTNITALSITYKNNNLHHLIIRDVKQLTCLTDEILRNNFSLEHLLVLNCGEFRELPQSLYNLRSLKTLSIGDCTNFSSIPVSRGENHLTSLLKLRLYYCDGLTSLSSGLLEHYRSLESLNVNKCNNLVSLPLHVWEMPSLSYLKKSKCPKLESVPAGSLHCLTGLRTLRIGPFSELVDFEAFQLIFNGIQQLSSLRVLWVYGHAHWDSLPYQHLEFSSVTEIGITDFGIKAFPIETLELVSCKQLQHLLINDCPYLEALSDGLGNLVSLVELSLSNCKNLQHLPSRDAMRRLAKLRRLKIKGCPQLEESCTNRSGPNSQWSKISHIPQISVECYGEANERYGWLMQLKSADELAIHLGGFRGTKGKLDAIIAISVAKDQFEGHLSIKLKVSLLCLSDQAFHQVEENR